MSFKAKGQARIPIKHFRCVPVNDWMRATDPVISKVTLTDCGKEVNEIPLETMQASNGGRGAYRGFDKKHGRSTKQLLDNYPS